MLLMVMDNQLLSPQSVCTGCLLADQSGQPRWHQGQLRCGHPVAVRKFCEEQPTQYECHMGFRLVSID